MAEGRTPRPASLKLLNGRHAGVDSGGRKVKPPPAFVRLPPEPPSWLDGEAYDEWQRVAPELQRLGLTKSVDAASLAAYCTTWAMFVDAQREYEEQGMTVQTSQGEAIAPWVRVMQSASKELRMWCQEFGLSPSAEGRLTTREAEAGAGEESAFA